MIPRPSQQCYSFIEGIEKFRPTAYKPTKKDVWTLGYGHTKGVKEGDTCTMSQAKDWIVGDVDGAWEYLARVCKVPLNQNQVDALTSLGFNIEEAISPSHTLMTKLNAGDYAGAADQILRWDFQDGTELDGLKKRRIAERAMFLKA